MADEKEEPQRSEGLTCPLCLEAFKIPTLLRCGHTFCKACLEKYDEQHNDQEHLECPVCRKRTKLDEKRVAGLSPNFSVLGLQDELNVTTDLEGRLSSNFCLLHKTEYRNIYCVVCEDIICLTCLIESHPRHKIMKKEKFEEELIKKRVALLEESNSRKSKAVRYVENAEQEKKKLHCKLSNMKSAIREAFARKVSVLHENQEELLQNVQSLREKSDKLIESRIGTEKQLIDKIESSYALLTQNTKHLDANMLKLHRLQCVDFGNALRTTCDEESIATEVEATARTEFRPSDEKFLSIGHIRIRAESLSNNIQHSAAASVGPTASPIPTAVTSHAVGVVKTVDIPIFQGMAAQSENSVVIGGSTGNGSDSFYVSGDKKTHLISTVGTVYDITFLTDGSAVVSHGKKVCHLYDAHGVHVTGVQYMCKEGSFFVKLYSDKNDDIYAVNGNPEVYIFHGRNPHPQRIVSAGCVSPMQVCVTSTGMIITSNTFTNERDTYTLSDRMGCSYYTITTKELNVFTFVTVDSLDRLLVAKVKCRSSLIRLSRYSLDVFPANDSLARSLRLPHAIQRDRTWCYLASLTPDMFALANGSHLYFINLAG